MNPQQQLQARNLKFQLDHGGFGSESKWVTDRELVATLVAHGQPKWAAERDIKNPQARMFATRFWLDVQDAGEGDKQAHQRVDFLRAQWNEMRKQELISDDPMRQADLLLDPRTLL